MYYRALKAICLYKFIYFKNWYSFSLITFFCFLIYLGFSKVFKNGIDSVLIFCGPFPLLISFLLDKKLTAHVFQYITL